VDLTLPSDKYFFRVPAPHVGNPVLNVWGKT